MKSIQKSTSNDRLLSEIIINTTERALSETSLTKSHLAELISDRDKNSIFFTHTTKHTPANIGVKAQQSNLKKIQRYLNWEICIPSDLLVIWSDCLPAGYSSLAKSEMANAFMPKKIGGDSESVIKELSDVICVIAGRRADEVIRAEGIEALIALKNMLGGNNE